MHEASRTEAEGRPPPPGETRMGHTNTGRHRGYGPDRVTLQGACPGEPEAVQEAARQAPAAEKPREETADPTGTRPYKVHIRH